MLYILVYLYIMYYSFVIYRFIVHDKIYIGSTYDYDLRMYSHQSKLKNGTNKLYKYINECNLDFNSINIDILYVSKKFTTKDYLIKHLIEQHFINLYNSIEDGLNTYNAYISIEQREKNKMKFHYAHRDEILEKLKLYKIEKQDIFNRKTTCCCGVESIARNLKRHQESSTHTKNMIYLRWKNIIDKLI